MRYGSGTFVRAACAALFTANCAYAQQAATAPDSAPSVETVIAPSAAEPSVRTLARNTVVEIEFQAELSSKTAKIGAFFPVRLAVPLRDAAGATLLPAGIVGEGEVIHAAKSGLAGKAGELVVTVRYLQCGATRIPLGRFHFGVAGGDKSREAVGITAVANGAAVFLPGAGVAGLLSFAIKGGNVVIPVGARGTARLKEDVALPEDAAAPCPVAGT